jgi:hypothetical protein
VKILNKEDLSKKFLSNWNNDSDLYKEFRIFHEMPVINHTLCSFIKPKSKIEFITLNKFYDTIKNFIEKIACNIVFERYSIWDKITDFREVKTISRIFSRISLIILSLVTYAILNLIVNLHIYLSSYKLTISKEVM